MEHENVRVTFELKNGVNGSFKAKEIILTGPKCNELTIMFYETGDRKTKSYTTIPLDEIVRIEVYGDRPPLIQHCKED